MIINLAFAFLYATTYYFVDIAWLHKDVQEYNKANRHYSSFYLTVCLLSIISGIYLGVAIYRIKKLITEKEDLVNTKIMVIHAATFGIYMFSTLVSVSVFGLYSWQIVNY